MLDVLVYILQVIVGFFITLIPAAFVLPLIPGLIDSLTNNPNANRPGAAASTRDYEKSESGFFTYLQPGRVKIIQRGGRFVRAIMLYNRHRFNGEDRRNPLTQQDADYWEVVPSGGFPDSHPIPAPWKKASSWWWVYSPASMLFWAWKLWVFKITGAIFTGIPPFQTVRVYPMEHFKRVTNNGAVQLTRVDDFSDHYRVADFQLPEQVTSADTSDNIPLDVMYTVIARVFNPYLAAYNTDNDWPVRVRSAIAGATTAFTRPKKLAEVWTSTEEEVHALSNAIKAIGDRAADGSICSFGIMILEVQVNDISPSDQGIIVRLGDVAIAEVDRKAAEIRSEGEAAYIKKEGAALREFPEGAIVVDARARVQTAQAAGKQGTVIVNSGGGRGIDVKTVALMAKLEKNKPGGDAS